MKKIFFAALAAVALTACVADVATEDPTYAIDFGSDTKIGVKSLVKFSVFAFNNETAEKTNTIMNDMLVEKEGNKWTYSPKKYWPAEGDVDFYGVSIEKPANSEYTHKYGATAAGGLTFDIDMKAAAGVVDAANIPDAVYAAAMGQEKDDANNPVQMTFRHAMAWVDFKICNNTTPADEITVTSGDVYVEGLKCDGKYIVEKGITTSAGADSPIGAWDLENNNISYLFRKKETTIAADVKSESILNDKCLVFPQTTGKNKVEFKVWFTIKLKGVVIFNGFRTAQAEVNWMQGYKYTYTFALEDHYPIENEVFLSEDVVAYENGK